MRERTCAPNPNLLESMRSVGYDLNTAIADIIDNSIAANATKKRRLDCLVNQRALIVAGNYHCHCCHGGKSIGSGRGPSTGAARCLPPVGRWRAIPG